MGAGGSRTLERKPSKEEIISSVAQRFGVPNPDMEAPIAFTSDADTLVSLCSSCCEDVACNE